MKRRTLLWWHKFDTFKVCHCGSWNETEQHETIIIMRKRHLLVVRMIGIVSSEGSTEHKRFFTHAIAACGNRNIYNHVCTRKNLQAFASQEWKGLIQTQICAYTNDKCSSYWNTNMFTTFGIKQAKRKKKHCSKQISKRVQQDDYVLFISDLNLKAIEN